MSLKGNLVFSAPTAVASQALKHPSLREVVQANRSKTRLHSEAYHAVLKKFDIRKDYNEPLLAWYGARGDLPWRSDLTDEQLQALSEDEKAQRAYGVWVSEIMLQQTQVATVIPYYARWISAFPTVQALAKADIEDVNAIWKGLGYYSRASRLLEGAKTVVKSYKGKLPSDPETLVKKIEGIGPYTAGAIASIAYGVKTPTVDGNIQRVICRLLALHADMKKKATLDYIWEVAEELVPDKRAGHWNQALMDLGATVCTPKNPKCAECPLKQVCLANTEVWAGKRPSNFADIEDLHGKTCKMCLPLDPPSLERDVTNYPMKVVKKKSREEDIAVCVVEWRHRADPKSEAMVLLVKRPKTGLLAGLDEFPSVILDEEESSMPSRDVQSSQLLHDLLKLPAGFSVDSEKDYDGLRVLSSNDLGKLKHVYSHINAYFHCRHLVLYSECPPSVRKIQKERCRWVSKTAVKDANIHTGAVKIWRLVDRDLISTKGKPFMPKSQKKVKEDPGNMKLPFQKIVRVNGQTNAPSTNDKVLENAKLSPKKLVRVDHPAAEVEAFEPSPKKRKIRRISISSSEE